MKWFLLYFLAVGVVALELPPDFPKCKRSDPKLNDCMKTAIEGALKLMEKGLPEFKVEPIQPITVPSLTIGQGKGPVQVVQNYENFKIYNLPSAKVADLSSRLSDSEFKMNITFLFKEVYLASQYKLNGKILLLPIVGEGDCTIKLMNAKVPMEMVGRFFEKKGVKYAEISDIKVHLGGDKVEFDFKNLFNGDPRLGPEMNRILNENWKEIFDDVKYAYDEAFGAIFKNIVNLIVRKVPYDELLPIIILFLPKRPKKINSNLKTFSIIASFKKQETPNFLKCKRSDPKINDCLKPAVGRAIHIMAEGMPDFKIEPIQPIRVPSLKIEGSVTQSYEDFQIFNVPSAKITHLDSSITDDEFNLNLTVFLKDIHIAARYKLQGQILLLPIVGEGNCTTDLRNAKVSLALSGVPTEKTGRKNVEIRSLKVNLDPEKVEFDFENLFNGDTQLGPQMNRIMNENSREIFNDVRHGYEEALGAVFKNIANLIFKRIPYDELVPL
ncbi:hypothetical protein PPYR_14551 [Photinus pyralis]|uniref:Uncharacterized protein n=1 Tax=Photinus pyralis TaxID=7054 RepID=A0A5N4A5L6_PHOPY|nr:hypothetical protein PPYR_14551 [Photinus pyralis]